MTDKLAAAENALEEAHQEIARLREDVRHLQSINQAERLDHISTIGEVQKANEQLADCHKECDRLTAVDAFDHRGVLVDKLAKQLADCRAALAEACKIAEDWIGDATAEADATRISALRKAGGL